MKLSARNRLRLDWLRLRLDSTGLRRDWFPLIGYRLLGGRIGS